MHLSPGLRKQNELKDRGMKANLAGNQCSYYKYSNNGYDAPATHHGNQGNIYTDLNRSAFQRAVVSFDQKGADSKTYPVELINRHRATIHGSSAQRCPEGIPKRNVAYRIGEQQRSNSELDLDRIDAALVNGTSKSAGKSANDNLCHSVASSYRDLHDIRINNMDFVTRSSQSIISSNSDLDEISDMCDGLPRGKLKINKPRAKSITYEYNLFKKLRNRGELSDGSDSKTAMTLIESANKSEDSSRQRSFMHYDCQSICSLALGTSNKRMSIMKRRNTTTGASAASAAALSRLQGLNATYNEHSCTDMQGDEGDGKNNNLVLSCPFFRNEIDAEVDLDISLSQLYGNISSLFTRDIKEVKRKPLCCGLSIIDTTKNSDGNSFSPYLCHKDYIIEYLDSGSLYYRHFFKDYDHVNYFGTDSNLGPIAVSVRREMLTTQDKSAPIYIYRIIFRTSELLTLRGSIREDCIPTSGRLATNRSLPIKDVLQYVLPDLQVLPLRLATPGHKTAEQLMKLDEQGVRSTYKVGIMLCRAGQSTEEDMYNNEYSSDAFDEFLECIGRTVRLKGFPHYRAQLDNKSDSSGTHSVYSRFAGYEIMFHVSTMLPFTKNNSQQLLRKRHIGNDIVTVIFQEPGACPFTPKTIRSQFQHVFIIVRAIELNTDNVRYSIAVSRSKDVPAFGPSLPDDNCFAKSQEFADFLLAKIINGENAAHQSEKFIAMATRTRQEYLKDLCLNHVTSTPLDTVSKLGRFSLGGNKKKEKTKNKNVSDYFINAAIVWNVQVGDENSPDIDCHLGIASEFLVLVNDDSKNVILAISTTKLIGWMILDKSGSLKLYYDDIKCLVIKVSSSDEISEIVQRIKSVSSASQVEEMTLKRNGLGHLGFHIHRDGFVTNVDPNNFAWFAGLRDGWRIVEVCKVAMCTMNHSQIVDLLRTSNVVSVAAVQSTMEASISTRLPSSSMYPVYESTYGSDAPRVHSHPLDSSFDTIYTTRSHHTTSDSNRDTFQNHDNFTPSNICFTPDPSKMPMASSTNVEPSYSNCYKEIGHSLSNVHKPLSGDADVSEEESAYGTLPHDSGDKHVIKDIDECDTPIMRAAQNTRYLLSHTDEKTRTHQVNPATSNKQVKLPPESPTAFSTPVYGKHYIKTRGQIDFVKKESNEVYNAKHQRSVSIPAGFDQDCRLLKVQQSPNVPVILRSPNLGQASHNKRSSWKSSEDILPSRLRHACTASTTNIDEKHKSAVGHNFEENLKRLINPDVLETNIDSSVVETSSSLMNLQKSASIGSLHLAGGHLPINGDGVCNFSARDLTSPTSSSATYNSYPSENRLSFPLRSGLHQFPLPATTMDWSSLVDVASKAIQDNMVSGKDSPSSNVVSRGSPETCASEHHQLQAQILNLEHHLNQERDSRTSLQKEVEHLKNYLKLQTEAATKFREITKWFYSTASKQ